jgi:alkanesulfonate monooxygenase SsuD/methylene tetrahydromethanopterin reductase-like flavin-dependent oxidoreductase (luciferase family)
MLHDAARLPKVDPWIALAAVATATNHIRLGPMVTPLARRRPWKVARETVTLDHLSGGRLILGVGLGDPSAEEFAWFDETGVDRPTRARMLDEGLTIVAGLWSSRPFGFEGNFYRLHEMTFLPVPVQSPRIPIWVGGWWPNRAPLQRAARWDGAHPNKLDGPLSPADVAQLVAYLRRYRPNDAPFDVVVADRLPIAEAGRLSERVRTLERAGATWWLLKAGAIAAASLELIVRHGPPT